MSTMIRRVAGITAMAAFAAGLVVAAAPPAAAEPECLTGSFDFDRDHRSDQVIASPHATVDGVGQAGSVQVRLSNEDDPIVVEVTAPQPAPGDQFGSAVSEIASYYDEGEDRLCSQLVVGAPGHGVGSLAGAGTVYVFVFDGGRFAVRGEFRPGLSGVPGTAQAQARFGAALAAPTHADDIAPLMTRLYVGAPGQQVGAAKQAGQVTSFAVDNDTAVAVDPQVLDHDTAGIPGAAASGGQLGAALAIGPDGVLFAGAPGQPAGTAARAGAVLVIPYFRETEAKPFQISQATPGVAGTPETGDEFGAAVSVDGRETTRVLIGAPGEAVGSAEDAGMVVVAEYAQRTGVLAAITAADQSTPGVAGAPERGDRFGSSLTTFDAASPHVLAGYLVGVPGEDLGGVVDAGMIQTLADGVGWHQDSPGMPGVAEAGDRFGASLSWRLIGVPGENDGAGWAISGLPVGGQLARGVSATHHESGAGFGSAVATTDA